MIKINYSKSRIKGSKISAFLFLLFGIIFIIISPYLENDFKSIMRSVGFGQISVGVFYIFYYLFERKNQYLTITDNQIIRNRIFPEKINKDKIQSIQYHAKKYTLNLEYKKFIIDTYIINPDSIEVLKSELQKIEDSL